MRVYHLLSDIKRGVGCDAIAHVPNYTNEFVDEMTRAGYLETSDAALAILVKLFRTEERALRREHHLPEPIYRDQPQNVCK